jgi:hypothetical protein
VLFDPWIRDRELRAQCLSALLEYEESLQAWEEARNSGELDSDGTDSGDEGELTGNELLRDLRGAYDKYPPWRGSRDAAKPHRMAQESPATDHPSVQHRSRYRVEHQSG